MDDLRPLSREELPPPALEFRRRVRAIDDRSATILFQSVGQRGTHGPGTFGALITVAKLTRALSLRADFLEDRASTPIMRTNHWVSAKRWNFG